MKADIVEEIVRIIGVDKVPAAPLRAQPHRRDAPC